MKIILSILSIAIVALTAFVVTRSEIPTIAQIDSQINSRIETINNYLEAQFDQLGAANNAVGGKKYNLSGSGVSSSQNTIGLTNFDVAGATIDLVMTNFGALGCGTLEPGHSTRQEFVSFTGVTQNADDSATLTGVTRGLSPVPDYTASSTQQKSHSGGSAFVISNSPPCFYEDYASLTQDETITGAWTSSGLFTFDADNPPTLDATGTTATNTAQLISKEYADNLVNQGAATSSESIAGIIEQATKLEMASSTAFDANNPHAINSENATSTPSGDSFSGLFVVISKINGKISQLWIDLTETYIWTALHTFTGGLTSTATTTLDGSDVNGNAVVINTVAYQFPNSQSAGVLNNNGSGVLSWANAPRYSIIDTGNLQANGDGSGVTAYATSSQSLVIPSGVFTASSTIQVKANLNCDDAGAGGNGNCFVFVRDSDGNTLGTCIIADVATDIVNADISLNIINNTTSSQISMCSGLGITDGGTASQRISTEGTASIDLSGGITLKLVIKGVNVTANMSNFFMIVNP